MNQFPAPSDVCAHQPLYQVERWHKQRISQHVGATHETRVKDDLLAVQSEPQNWGERKIYVTLNVVGVFTGIFSRVCRERSRKEREKKKEGHPASGSSCVEEHASLMTGVRGRSGRRLVGWEPQRGSSNSNSQWLRARSAMQPL